MARINKALLERVAAKLDLSKRRVYELIDAKVRETLLDRPLAALAVARENGINVHRYSTQEDRAELRQHLQGSPEREAPARATLVEAPRQPSSGRPAASRDRKVRRPAGPKQTVFVIHGRNEGLHQALHTFLRAVGLKPIEWHHALRLSGEPSAYVQQIIDAAFQKADAFVVLLTGDDEVRLRRGFWKRDEERIEKTLTRQARPNVLFEAGMAFAKKPTVLVQVGKVKTFSDVVGRHVLRLTDSPDKRKEFIIKLRNAGLRVDDDGTEWMTAGSFDVES